MSPEDSPSDASPVTLDQQLEHRKRKADRACDFCRRRKSRCDGDQIARKSCSNCTINNLRCTYRDTAKRQVISKAYVESLERRIEELEGTLERYEQLSPTGEGGSPLTTTSTRPSSPTTPISQDQMREMARAMIRVGMRHRQEPDKPVEIAGQEFTLNNSFCNPGEFNPQDEELSQRFSHLHMGTSIFNRFLGKSSTAHLVLKLISLKKQPDEPYRVPISFLNGRRARYWAARPWECALLETKIAQYDFPEEELMSSLIDLYFDNVQLYFPLLHRPTFEEGLRSGQYLEDHDLGSIVLLVCALGARYSDDPRVLSEEYDNDGHSAGWKWFSQAEKTRRPIFGAPSLLELESYCLSILFMLASSNLMTQHIWTRIGVAIRYIQDVGAHRRTRRKIPTIVDELWNRAAWILVTMDRNLSAILGRNCAMPDEDFDIRYPMNVDDEYWYNPSDPENSWKQPADKPSKTACFIQYIKLSSITEVAIRTIYGTNKHGFLKKFMGEGWERDFVQELDSALNQWMDEMPEYLRWDPEQTNLKILNQAVFLHCSYRQTQILIHRPFITAHPLAPNPGLPSLTICTTAARACAHILEQQRRKTGAGLPYVMFSASVCAIVLLVSMWTRAKPRSSRDQLKEFKDIHLLMDYLKSMEDRWVTAGRTWDVLDELCSIGDMPNSQLGKRPRDTGEDQQQPSPPERQAGTSSARECLAHRADVMGPSQFAPSTPGHVDVNLAPLPQPQGPAPPIQDGMAASTMFQAPGAPLENANQFGYPSDISAGGMSPWFPPAGNGGAETFSGASPAWASFGEVPMAGASRSTSFAGMGDVASGMDQDSMTIWSSVPNAFDPNEWVTYLAGLAEVAHDQGGGPSVQHAMGAEDTVAFPDVNDGSSFYGGNPAFGP
ncbi:fungal-specific transcription factor domain-containing protein [Schizophyllum fasciatum]